MRLCRRCASPTDRCHPGRDGHTPRRTRKRGYAQVFCHLHIAEYLLLKSADKGTVSQRQRAEVLFETYPDLKKAYSLTHSLRMIFSKNSIKDDAELSPARWYDKVNRFGFKTLISSQPLCINIMTRSKFLCEQDYKCLRRIFESWSIIRSFH